MKLRLNFSLSPTLNALHSVLSRNLFPGIDLLLDEYTGRAQRAVQNVSEIAATR